MLFDDTKIFNDNNCLWDIIVDDMVIFNLKFLAHLLCAEMSPQKF